jgi:hypothetical protein
VALIDFHQFSGAKYGYVFWDDAAVESRGVVVHE